VAGEGKGTRNSNGATITDPVAVITVRAPRISLAALTKVLAPASVTAEPMPSANAKRAGST